MQFREQLSAETFIDLAKLQDMSRYGIPDVVRGEGMPSVCFGSFLTQAP
jgi:hypothetical protein